MKKKGQKKFGIILAIIFFLIIATSTTLTSADSSQSDPIWIGESSTSKVWDFETSEEDNDIYTNISIVNETALELILDAFDVDSLPGNYKWDMAVCNISGINWLQYMEEDAQGGFDDSYPEDLEYVFLEYEGLPSGWCESTGGYGFVLFSSGSKNQLPEHFRLIFPNTTEEFELYFGNGTGILVGSSHTSSTEHSYTDKMVRDSNNNLHILFRDDGKDPHHWNSTDNTTFNSVADITTTDGDRMNLVIDSNDNLYATFYTSSTDGIYFANKTPDGSWSTPENIFDSDSSDSHYFVTSSMAIDSNNVIHMCIVTGAWNNSANNDWLIYTNWSLSQGWWSDDSVCNATGLINEQCYNGTWLATDDTDDTDSCDIEVDTNNNVYILTSGGDHLDIDIWSNKDDFASRNPIYEINTNRDPAIAINPNTDDIYIAFSTSGRLAFANNTADNWNGEWTFYEIDGESSIHPDIEVSNDGDIYIIYTNSSSADDDYTVFIANSSSSPDSASDWTNRTEMYKDPGNWAGAIQATMRGSTFPVFNRVTDAIEYLFWNDTDNGIYYGRIELGEIEENIYLNITLNLPPSGSSTSVSQNSTFTVNASVSCISDSPGATCGEINGTVRYNSSESGEADTSIDTDPISTPFWALTNETCGVMNSGDNCNLTWEVNATGDLDTQWYMDVNFTSNVSVLSNATEDAIVTIVNPVHLTLQWSNLNFSSMVPGEYGNGTGNTNRTYNITIESGSCNVDLYIKGTDLEKNNTNWVIGTGNITWNTTNSYPGYRLNETYYTIATNIAPSTDTTTYYWLDAPSVEYGNYTGTIWIKGCCVDESC